MRKFRRLVFNLHLYLGLSIGVTFSFLCLTGSLLAFEAQIIGWREARVFDPAAAELAPSQIIKAAEEYRPGLRLNSATWRADTAFPVEIKFAGGGTVLVDPQTGAVKNGSGLREFYSFLTRLHRYFSFSDKAAQNVIKTLNGLAMIIFFLMTVTGTYLYVLGRWRMKTVRGSHAILGLVFALPLLALTLTGLVMSHQWANDWLFRLAGSEPPPRAEEAREGKKDQPETAFDWNSGMKAAQERVPDWKIVAFRIAGDKVTATIQGSERWPVRLRSQLVFNSTGSEIKKWEPAAGTTAGRKARTLARFLHTGEAGGIWGQALALLASMAGLVIGWTGLQLAYRRFFCDFSRQ